MYEIRFSKKAEKAYRKLPGNVKMRIDQKLNYLRLTPRGPDTKKLVGEQNAYRTRVGTYRIVYEIEDKHAGILVDNVIGQQQVVIKSLENNYRSVPGLAGATVLGDGSVALILDLASLANLIDKTSNFLKTG